MRSGSRPRPQTPPTFPYRCMNRVSCTLLPVLLALILLPAIAFASPPDPSWIAGIYDGADGDDIVSLVYETSAANQTAPSHFGPLPCLLAVCVDGIARYVPDGHFIRGSRSPPVLRAPGSYLSSIPCPLLHHFRKLLSPVRLSSSSPR